MQIKTVKTHKITKKDTDITKIIDKYVKDLPNRSILAITSKVISITEGSIVEMEGVNKDDLIKQQSQYFLDKNDNLYKFSLTITQNLLIPTAGIDESNGNGYYILWPQDPQKSANNIREHLSRRFKGKQIGVIITDSKSTPLRTGTTGVGIAHSGFMALNNYVGKKDLFGRELKFTYSNIMDGYSASAVSVMGEGIECTPMAVISDIPNVKFVNRNPTKVELNHLHIPIDVDVYSSILKLAPWQKGGKPTT